MPAGNLSSHHKANLMQTARCKEQTELEPLHNGNAHVKNIVVLQGKIVTPSDFYCFGSETKNERDETVEAEKSAEKPRRPHSSHSVRGQPPPAFSVCCVNKHRAASPSSADAVTQQLVKDLGCLSSAWQHSDVPLRSASHR